VRAPDKACESIQRREELDSNSNGNNILYNICIHMVIKFFTSPDILVLQRRCSICSRLIRPRSRCEHKRGEIYDGRYCTGIVTEVRLLGASLVENPDFKANVVFLIDDETGEPFDHFDYPLLEYLMQRLASPWSPWDARRTERLQPFSRFGDLDDDASCPCESGFALRDCCRSRGGIRASHIEFLLSDPVPPELQQDQYIEPTEEDEGIRLGRRYRPFQIGGQILEAPVSPAGDRTGDTRSPRE
jgi:hypothetical protein